MSSAPAGAFPSGLARRELAAYVEHLGVAEEQVHRDHLISILLAGRLQQIAAAKGLRLGTPDAA